ncbi:unnamed protein product [Menidia menidia]|uniref:(Atlantic silverside) hypothetical protein n=1 Tax=Menidia menidia TaxID=238744 RepID=A0A8S4C134_9TELE|nr:unnamed protein product [Menidia menidia]
MLRFGGRMFGFSALLSLLLAGLVVASSDLFDNQLGDINYCKKQCQITVKNKSPAKSGSASRKREGACVVAVVMMMVRVTHARTHARRGGR